MADDAFSFDVRGGSPEEQLQSLFGLCRGVAALVLNRVGGIDSYHSLLEEEVAGNRAACGYLANSRRAAAQSRSCLRTFLDQLTPPQALEDVDVRLLLDGAARRCLRILPEGRTLELDPAPEETVVAGSLFQLQEVFMTAIMATVQAAPDEVREFRVSARVCALEARFFELLGSGCGAGDYFVASFAPAAAEFVPDRQVPFAVAAQELAPWAAGLRCLAIYGFVTGHGGEICFQPPPAPGGLAALNVLLPVQGKRKDMLAPQNAADSDLLGTETILLVDDEDMIWDVIIDMLQELGYTVILAANGREAVEIYRDNPGAIDLVLLDMVMPEMDGHAAFFALKQIDPEVKVLLSSGYVSEADARDVLEAGAVGFLQKPYRMVDLARRVRQIFAER